jgi:phosphonate transport system substrate-binding protein
MYSHYKGAAMRLHPMVKKNPCLLSQFLIVSLLILASGCSSDAEYKPIDFSRTITVSQPESRFEKTPTLRVAVAAMISPKETFIYYRELLAYIGQKLGYDVRLIQRKTYGEINELFPKGQIDLAFICTGPYAVGKKLFRFEALATPVIRGQPFYHSYLIVHKNSDFQQLQDLKGQVFAFTDPESNTGALVPNFWLKKIGKTPQIFFENVTYSYSHDNSILAVAKGLVDGATVDGHIWEYYNRRKPFYTDMTRVIKKSEPFGSPPLVASAYLSQRLKLQMKQLLISMHNDPEGRRILQELMIDRFVEPRQEWYRPVRQMFDQVHTNGKMQYATEKS